MENSAGQWFVQTSMGRVGFAFVPRNEYGVLDHDVTLPSGEVVYNPMRVIPDGGMDVRWCSRSGGARA